MLLYASCFYLKMPHSEVRPNSEYPKRICCLNDQYQICNVVLFREIVKCHHVNIVSVETYMERERERGRERERERGRT